MKTILVFNDIEIILISLSALFLIIQIFYYTLIYNRIARHNKACAKGNVQYSEEFPPLSIIICARDESDNLLRNLPSILEQDYPNFEVIVVNDGSTDESEEILKLMAARYPQLYHTFTPDGSRYLSRKKLALTLGIKASKHDWLVFTEANCKPTSNQWLKLMARNFTSKTDIVLGYSNCQSNKGWTNKRITFNLLFLAMRYMGMALCGKPYMAIGRNMAYRKELFFQQKGFSSHLNLLRGEDDLFVNKVANKSNTRVETDSNATIQMQNYYHPKDWREERMNYLTTARQYKGSQRYLLGFETTTRLLMYLAIVAGIVVSSIYMHWLMLGLFVLTFILRFITQTVIINKTAKSLGHNFKFITILPVFDILQPMQTLGYKMILMFKSKNEYRRR